MSQPNHEWIENYRDFEAVLRCTNALGEWEEGAALRAFQTFGWDDASTPGNDLTFTHVETGVIVRHEGELVAIDFAGERLTEALADLFAVLCSLGWKLAEVYHPKVSMGALLSDMARAIPAHMNLDLCPAKNVEEVIDSPEGAALVARGRVVMGASGMDEFNADALGELESMDETFVPLATGGEALPQSGPIFLTDDPDEEPKVEFVRVEAISTRAIVAPSGGGRYSSADDETPRPFLLPGSPEALAAEREVAFVHPPMASNEPVPRRVPKLEQEVAQPIPEASPVTAPGEMVDVAVQNLQARPEPVELQMSGPASVLPPAAIEHSSVSTPREGKAANNQLGVAMHGINRVGLSAFCFDLPRSGLSAEDVINIAEQCAVTEVVHLRPGVMNEAIRWDVLGELDNATPWFAEKLVRSMNCGTMASAFLAGLFHEVRAENQRAQLRDIVTACIQLTAPANDAYDHDAAVAARGEVFSKLLPVTRPLFRPGTAGFTSSLDGFIERFGAILLCTKGNAFVDVQHEELEVFSVREVMQSPKARLFVVHVDELDGPFVTNVAELLWQLARSYALTKRFDEVVSVNKEIGAKEQQKAELLEKSHEQLSQILSQLREAGVTIQ